MKALIWWFNPINWLAENWKKESARRLQALESHIQEQALRINLLENEINLVKSYHAGLFSTHLHMDEGEFPE